MGRSVRTPRLYVPPKTTIDVCPHCQARRVVTNGAWLRWKRETAQIDQRALAASLGLSGPYLSDIERNRRDCPARVLRAYRELL